MRLRCGFRAWYRSKPSSDRPDPLAMFCPVLWLTTRQGLLNLFIIWVATIPRTPWCQLRPWINKILWWLSLAWLMASFVICLTSICRVLLRFSIWLTMSVAVCKSVVDNSLTPKLASSMRPREFNLGAMVKPTSVEVMFWPLSLVILSNCLIPGRRPKLRILSPCWIK